MSKPISDLELQIKEARKDIVSDGYDMSVGEVINLYKDEEIVINPDFQRYFRWEHAQKSGFIESLLLGIPIPPIFVYQDEDGVWELIDGLQRLSTIFEFVGELRGENGEKIAPSVLTSTRFLPSLANKKWESTNPVEEIGITQQLQIKRARIRVEILKQESHPEAKYELFQRLNTGGSQLTPQEVRNCIAIMVNRNFYKWLGECSKNADFLETIVQTDDAIMQQADMELALRFFAFRNVVYTSGLDVHEYLDQASLKMAKNAQFPAETEKAVFEKTFNILSKAMGDKAFKKWKGSEFSGKFLMSVYEVVATGVSKNIDAISGQKDGGIGFIQARCKDLWSDSTFVNNSGAGVRGTTRLANLIPMADTFFKP